LVNNHIVATSKGKIYHCPNVNCDKGLVYLDHFKFLAV